MKRISLWPVAVALVLSGWAFGAPAQDKKPVTKEELNYEAGS